MDGTGNKSDDGGQVDLETLMNGTGVRRFLLTDDGGACLILDSTGDDVPE